MYALEVIDIDPTTIMVVSSLLVPAAVSLLTKFKAPNQLKAGVNMALVAIVALVTNAINENGHAVLSLSTIRDWAIGMAVSIGAYYGVFKPNHVPENLIPNTGLGTEEVEPDEGTVPA